VGEGEKREKEKNFKKYCIKYGVCIVFQFLCPVIISLVIITIIQVEHKHEVMLH